MQLCKQRTATHALPSRVKRLHAPHFFPPHLSPLGKIGYPAIRSIAVRLGRAALPRLFLRGIGKWGNGKMAEEKDDPGAPATSFFLFLFLFAGKSSGERSAFNKVG